MYIPLPPRQRKHRGFTLIELMIAVAIVGILVAVAYPAYNQSVRKSRRADAKTALLDLAQREERFMSTQNVYTVDPVALGYNAGTTLPIPVMTSGTAYYNLSVAPATTGSTTDFIATATRTGAQSSDAECGDFKLDNTGVQSVTGTKTAASCW
jgi:type IV pilus assembly protein PilE